MNDQYAIQIQDLHKDFGEVYAVQGVSLEIRKGEVFSLLGPNGAGKSTIISMISCLMQPTSGEAFVMGHSVLRDPMAVKTCLGVVPQDIALYEDLSARENLAFWGKMYSLRGAPLSSRVDEILEIIGLSERQGGRVGKYSGGMKRRLNIGIALLHKPAIVVMDEPTVGIDPQSRRNILDSVMALNREGATVLYTTHYMEEAQELSDHIAIMDHGKVIALGTHDELVKTVGELDRVELVLAGPVEEALTAWTGVAGVHQVSRLEDADASLSTHTVALLVDDSNLVLPRLFESAAAFGGRITSVDIHEPNLETVFLHLTGRALRD